MMVKLESADGLGVDQVGGKAANLAILSKAGMKVPGGIVVVTGAYDAYLERLGLKEKISDSLSKLARLDGGGLSACSSEIREWFEAEPTDPELSESIIQELRRCNPETLWAVRSSAVSEDLPKASFAGQQDSYLCIPADEVPTYVRKCWASYWNERAIAYRCDADIDHFSGGIAVVVQEMVPCDCAGIMFTADPVSGTEGRIIIESAWGLGESIASGMVTPDRFIVDRKALEIVDRALSSKTRAVYLQNGRKSVVELDAAKGLSPSLDDEQLRRVAQAGLRIERLFGRPQDIEWAIADGVLYILQSRPITVQVRTDGALWTRAYGDEYWADATSPLFFSLLGEYLTEYVNHEGARIMGYRELTGTELLKLHKSHVYFNTEVLEKIFTYNPRFSRTKELLSYFPERDQVRIATAPTKIFGRMIAELRVALLDPDGMIFRTDKAYKAWAERFLCFLEDFDSLDLRKASDQQLRDVFIQLERAYLKHYRLIRYGMVTHSIGTNLILRKWLTDWLGDASGTLYSKLVSGLPENKTVETNAAIARLADAARDNQVVKTALLSMPADDFLDRLNSDGDFKGFAAEFKRFLAQFGHRSHTREILFPRWADEPRMVVEILRTLVAGSDRLNLGAVEEQRASERKRTEEEVMRKIGGMRHGFLRKLVFRTVLRYAQTYLAFRENQRFYLDHQIARQRRIFMEYGRRLAERGVLTSPDDVFFLSKDEIFDVIGNPRKDIATAVRRRREEFERYRNYLPAKFLRGTAEFEDEGFALDAKLTLTGTAASPGTFTGYARVVRSIDYLKDVRQGEILVALNTDPGWTAVFPKLGGVVTETGGILSHGAVVAREYGIPAVTAVKNATGVLKTGQRIIVDGNSGVVRIVQ
ncbi:MAG: PEP/pyruvate-binding domain-containing protein [Thermoplasmata archaeon]